MLVFLIVFTSFANFLICLLSSIYNKIFPQNGFWVNGKLIARIQLHCVKRQSSLRPSSSVSIWIIFRGYSLILKPQNIKIHKHNIQDCYRLKVTSLFITMLENVNITALMGTRSLLIVVFFNLTICITSKKTISVKLQRLKMWNITGKKIGREDSPLRLTPRFAWASASELYSLMISFKQNISEWQRTTRSNWKIAYDSMLTTERKNTRSKQL